MAYHQTVQRIYGALRAAGMSEVNRESRIALEWAAKKRCYFKKCTLYSRKVYRGGTLFLEALVGHSLFHLREPVLQISKFFQVKQRQSQLVELRFF